MVAAIIRWTVLAAILGSAAIATAQAPGDVDCDGRLTDDDVRTMVGGLFGERPACSVLDGNRDGSVSAGDLVAAIVPLFTPTAPGPQIVHFGIAAADGLPIRPFAHWGDTAIFARGSGSGFKLVVEAAPTVGGALPGRRTAHLETTSVAPDMQIGCTRMLGDGSPTVCSGGVPSIIAPHFDARDITHRTFNDLGCFFETFTSATASCTVDSFGNPGFQQASTRVQYCFLVSREREFPAGDTVCSVRVRDTNGMLGPLKSIVIRIGTPNPPTFTPTATATVAAPTSTPTATPSVTFAPSTSTRTPTATPPAITPLSTPTTPTTPAQSPPSTPSTPTSATNSPTPSITRTGSPTSTPTRTPTITVSATPSASATRSRTPTPTASPTPTGFRGPIVTHFGLALANENLVQASGTTATGVPIYTRDFGWGFRIVIEGRTGPSGSEPGTSAFQPGGLNFADLQILSSRPLGNGSAAVCDRLRPDGGGVPAVTPPIFATTPSVVGASNDLTCRFLNGTGAPVGRLASSDSCVQVPANSATYRFASLNSMVQFCSLVDSFIEFPEGDTILTARLRDRQGNAGAPAQMIVRIITGD